MKQYSVLVLRVMNWDRSKKMTVTFKTRGKSEIKCFKNFCDFTSRDAD